MSKSSKFVVPDYNSQLGAVWGKWEKKTRRWEPLMNHLLTTMEMGSLIWRNIADDDDKHTLAEVFGSEDVAHKWVRFYCGIHDVGKASPLFQSQSKPLSSALSEVGLLVPEVPQKWLTAGRHDAVGAWAVAYYLAENRKFRQSNVLSYAAPVGRHHDRVFDADVFAAAGKFVIMFETHAWQLLRNEIIGAVFEQSGLTKAQVHSRTTEKLPDEAVDVVVKIVRLADKISSDSYFFPYSKKVSS